MTAQHSLRIDYDEATGRLVVTHRCTVVVAGHAVSHAREIELGEGTAAALSGFLDANRETLAAEAQAHALVHVAAVTGKTRKGVTPLKVGGSLSAAGGTEAAKG